MSTSYDKPRFDATAKKLGQSPTPTAIHPNAVKVAKSFVKPKSGDGISRGGKTVVRAHVRAGRPVRAHSRG